MCNNKIIKDQKGVSLIITFFIMIIILTVVLSISILLYSEVKVMRNIDNAMTSIYAAESGIEKVLYYDRQVIPSGATRGLCSMLSSANTGYCTVGSSGNDTSIYCNASSGDTNFPNPQGIGCSTCTNPCTVMFSTNFDNRNYSVSASVNSNYLDITSTGVFGGAKRRIEITTPSQ